MDLGIQHLNEPNGIRYFGSVKQLGNQNKLLGMQKFAMAAKKNKVLVTS